MFGVDINSSFVFNLDKPNKKLLFDITDDALVPNNRQQYDNWKVSSLFCCWNQKQIELPQSCYACKSNILD